MTADAPTTLLDGSSEHTVLLGRSDAPDMTGKARRNLEGTELLERYEVEQVIGEGGMATVYRGRHKAIQKLVAIKVLDDALEWPLDATERFLQEAQVTSRVVHENVVEVTDFGTTAEGVVFCVMELLHGETLAELIESAGPLPVSRAAEIMRQVCGALHAAHRHGIIHRDLKPANCFWSPRASNPDFVKVLDFGIARVAHVEDPTGVRHFARPRQTQIGFIIGTPDYMAPEQAREEPFDHRVDVYAAGGLFFTLLTGLTPYADDSVAELMAAHMYLPVPDPAHHVPSLPAAVREIVMTAMAKRPEDRYPSMAAMAQAIADALAPEDEWLVARRRAIHRRIAVASTVAALVLGAWMVSEPPASPSRAVPETTPVVEAMPAAVAQPERALVREVAPMPPPSAPPITRLANAMPTIEPAPEPAPSPPRKPARKPRAHVDPPADVVAPRSAAPLPTLDPEPIRAHISEVKDPFADAVVPVSPVSTGGDDRLDGESVAVADE
jgi:serine/threonine-protein kinase